MTLHILTLGIHSEHDVVGARQRARQIAAMLQFGVQEQTRITTAVSELARNAFKYASGGKVEFLIEGETAPQVLIVQISDSGPGIRDLDEILQGRYRSATGMGVGIVAARRLFDQCDIQTANGEGTTIMLKKLMPSQAEVMTSARLGELSLAFAVLPANATLVEVHQQNSELLLSLAELKARQDELLQLTRELEDTNRGVVALYAELDEKADHLRRADEMKSRFLSNMSHEFRTPLSSIRALSKLLLDRADGELAPEQEKQVSYILKSTEDLSELVNDLLDLAKIEAGKIEVRPVPFKVADLFSALRGMLRPLLVTRSVELIFETPREIPVFFTDEGKVSQILRNFISNALKFTEQGEVRISATLEPSGNAVRFSVRDTGLGITLEHQELIFEEFSQIENRLQQHVKGTGLGLPLCRKLAALLGGTLELESTPNVGSTFSALIPLRYAYDETAPLATTDEVADAANRIPVLVIEDEPQTRLLYEKYLRDTRYYAVSARNMREAEESWRTTKPGAVILDILLGGESTWYWLAEIKGDGARSHIPVIVATALEDRRKAQALGADAYFVKPLFREQLLFTLDQLTSPMASDTSGYGTPMNSPATSKDDSHGSLHAG